MINQHSKSLLLGFAFSAAVVIGSVFAACAWGEFSHYFLANYSWTRIPILVLAIFLHLMAWLHLGSYAFSSEEAKKDFSPDSSSLWSRINEAMTWPVGYLGTYATIASCWFFLSGGTEFAGLPSARPPGNAFGNGEVSMMLLDNLFRTLCLDFPETFYIDVSPVDHSKNVWACVFVFVFRTSVAAWFVACAINLAKQAHQYRKP